MKKILVMIALFLSIICLTGCEKKTKFATFTCTEYTVRKGASVLNMLDNYKDLELVFYKDGNFKWIGTTAEYYDEKGNLTVPSTDELLEGTYITEYIYETNEEGKEVVSGYKLTLYYVNNPTEQNNEGGYPFFIYQGDTLSRSQYQVTPSYSQLVKQTFKKK